MELKTCIISRRDQDIRQNASVHKLCNYYSKLWLSVPVFKKTFKLGASVTLLGILFQTLLVTLLVKKCFLSSDFECLGNSLNLFPLLLKCKISNDPEPFNIVCNLTRSTKNCQSHVLTVIVWLQTWLLG